MQGEEEAMRLLVWALLFVVTSCQRDEGSPHLLLQEKIRKGMSEQMVAELLGPPHHFENHLKHKIWFYKASSEESLKPSFLPLVFQEGYLMDWGYLYSNYRLLEEQKQEHSGDLEIAPKNKS
jgi:hypothetical protein